MKINDLVLRVTICLGLIMFASLAAQSTEAQQVYSPYGQTVDPMAGPEVYPYGSRSAYPVERPLRSRGYDGYYERQRAYVYGHPDDGAPSQAPFIPVPWGSLDY